MMKLLKKIMIVAILFLFVSSAQASWVDKFLISGDLRYRHERVDHQERDRQRIRGRLLVKADIEEDWSVGLRFATGSSSGATSTNQTLDGNFSEKNVWLDLLYFDYHPDGFNITGGKIKNPFYKVGKNQLVWDGDINPEGAAFKKSVALTDVDSVTFTAGGFWVDERKSAVDARILGTQVYLKHLFGEDHVIVGASDYSYDNLDTTDLEIVEVFGEYVCNALEVPLTFYGNRAQAEESSYLVGIKVNKAKAIGSWEVGYDYRELKEGAVYSPFDESDFVGVRGHKGYLKYQISKNVQTAATVYQTDESRVLQVDLKLKF
jgi:hypothetical protein